MEKRISFFEFQNAVSVAKLIDPALRKKEKAEVERQKLEADFLALKTKLDAVNHEVERNQKEIDAYEAGIVKCLGLHTIDLVQKVMIPTGKTTPAGKPAMESEYKPAQGITFDETTKEYVINIPDAQTEQFINN